MTTDEILAVVADSFTMTEASRRLNLSPGALRKRLDAIRIREQRYANLRPIAPPPSAPSGKIGNGWQK